MSAPDDGGRAFPSSTYAGPMGMTLRDWFAGQALAGMMASGSIDIETVFRRPPVDTAKAAYHAADAMLQQRKEAK